MTLTQSRRIRPPLPTVRYPSAVSLRLRQRAANARARTVDRPSPRVRLYMALLRLSSRVASLTSFSHGAVTPRLNRHRGYRKACRKVVYCDYPFPSRERRQSDSENVVQLLGAEFQIVEVEGVDLHRDRPLPVVPERCQRGLEVGGSRPRGNVFVGLLAGVVDVDV